MFKNEYRILKFERYNYYSNYRTVYDVQMRRWWFPVWETIRYNANSLEIAETIAVNHAKGSVVKYLGRLP